MDILKELKAFRKKNKRWPKQSEVEWYDEMCYILHFTADPPDNQPLTGSWEEFVALHDYIKRSDSKKYRMMISKVQTEIDDFNDRITAYLKRKKK